MIQTTKGLILRTVKYGETSVIVTAFTDLFGVQSYIVNGVRSAKGRSSGRANLFQPAAILELVVYHHEMKAIQRISEYRWSVLYEHIFYDIFKGSVATYMIELLTKCLKQPEPNTDLFDFMEDVLLHLDKASPAVVANFPLFFALHLANFFGFRVQDSYGPLRSCLDLMEGQFVALTPSHDFFLQGENSEISSRLLKVMQPAELEEIKISVSTRRELLKYYESYYAIHVPEFGKLRSLAVLQEVLS